MYVPTRLAAGISNGDLLLTFEWQVPVKKLNRKKKWKKESRSCILLNNK